MAPAFRKATLFDLAEDELLDHLDLLYVSLTMPPVVLHCGVLWQQSTSRVRQNVT